LFTDGFYAREKATGGQTVGHLPPCSARQPLRGSALEETRAVNSMLQGMSCMLWSAHRCYSVYSACNPAQAVFESRLASRLQGPALIDSAASRRFGECSPAAFFIFCCCILLLILRPVFDAPVSLSRRIEHAQLPPRSGTDRHTDKMDQTEGIELQSRAKDNVNVEVSAGRTIGGSLYSQTRTRRLFSFSQLFAFSLTYMALWEGMCTSVLGPPPLSLRVRRSHH
jgi:hypothetical protein